MFKIYNQTFFGFIMRHFINTSDLFLCGILINLINKRHPINLRKEEGDLKKT